MASRPERPVVLPPFRENERSEPFEAPLDQCRRLLAELPAEVRLEALPDRPGWFRLAAGPVTGVVEVAGLLIDVRPKLPVDRVLFLLGYLLDRRAWRDMLGWFDEALSLVDAMGEALARQAVRVLTRGRLHGYLERDDTLKTVRGRIALERQIRRWFGEVPPIEVTFCEYTDDILENRLIKAAVHLLLRWPLRRASARHGLRRVDDLLAEVAIAAFDPHAIPVVRYSRLNEHYRPAVELSRLVLRLAAFESRAGHLQSSGLLVNMNELFQDFVEVALTDALAGHGVEVRPQDRSRALDRRGEIRLAPDLVLARRGTARVIADAKYKRLESAGLPNADVYQALAYAVGFAIDTSVLVYPAREAARAIHDVPHARARILVRTLDLAASPDALMAEVRALSDELAAACVADQPSRPLADAFER